LDLPIDVAGLHEIVHHHPSAIVLFVIAEELLIFNNAEAVMQSMQIN